MPENIREAVGVFDNPEKVDAAIADLEGTAFPRHDISVLGSKKEVQEKFGSEAIKVEWLEDHPDSPRGIWVRPEEKTIGATAFIGALAYLSGCAAAILARDSSILMLLLAITGGSLAGAAVAGIIVFMIGYKMADKVHTQIKKGGLLLWVRTPDSSREKIAKDIFRKHGARHVHIHDIPA